MYRAKRTMGADDETVDFAELVRGVSLTVGAGLTACSLLLLGQLFYQGVRYKRRGLGERELRSSLKKYICLFLGCLLSIVGQIRVGLNSSPAMQSGQDLTNVFLSFPSVMLVGCTLFSFSRYLSTVQENKGDEIDTNERLKRKIGMAGVPLGCWTAYNLFPFCVGFFYGLLNAVVNLSGKEDWCEAGADYNGKKCALYFCLWVGSFTLAVMASIYVVYGLVKRGPGVGIVVATVSQLFQLGVVFLTASNEEEEEVGWVWLLNLCGHALNLTILVVVLIGFNVKYSIFEVAFEVSNIEADVWTLRDREEGFIEGKALRNRLSSCT